MSKKILKNTSVKDGRNPSPPVDPRDRTRGVNPPPPRSQKPDPPPAPPRPKK
jgi:hypothetical protein